MRPQTRNQLAEGIRLNPRQGAKLPFGYKPRAVKLRHRKSLPRSQGLQEDHSGVEIPYKKTKTRPLTKDERVYNHALSRFRVRVEHAIARLKSFRILSERYRYPKGRYGVKISTVAGILNIAAGF